MQLFKAMPGVMAGVLMMAVCVCVTSSAFAAERITLAGLVTADPVPAEYEVRQQDIKDGQRVALNLLVVMKEGSTTAAVVQIDRRTIAEKPARLAALKAYVNSNADSWAQRGYGVKVKSLPDLETIDFSKPVDIELEATKEGEATRTLHIRIIFDKFAYMIMCISNEPAQGKTMLAWARSVQPAKEAAATTQPAK